MYMFMCICQDVQMQENGSWEAETSGLYPGPFGPCIGEIFMMGNERTWKSHMRRRSSTLFFVRNDDFQLNDFQFSYLA